MSQPAGVPPTVVSVVDIQMPFGSMIIFLVKLALAAIPAMIILFIIGMILAAVGAGFVTGLMHH